MEEEELKQPDYVESVDTISNMLTCEHCDSRHTNSDEIKTHKTCHYKTFTHSSDVCPQQIHKNNETMLGKVGEKKVNKNKNPEENNQHNSYKCHMCCKEFLSICCLHNHLMDCIKSRSYIYDDSNKTAYPFLDSYDNLRTDEACNEVNKDDSPTKVNNGNVCTNERNTTERTSHEVDVVEDTNNLPSDIYKLWLEFYKAHTTIAKEGHETFYNTLFENEETDDYEFENSLEVKKGKRKNGCPKQLKRKTKSKIVERPSKKEKLEITEHVFETLIIKEEPDELIAQVNPTVTEEQCDVDNDRMHEIVNDNDCDESVDKIKKEIGDCVLDKKQKKVTIVPVYRKRKQATVKQKVLQNFKKKLKVKLSDYENDINTKTSTEGENDDRTNEDALNNRIKKKRTSDPIEKCETCDRLVKRSYMKTHARSHGDARPYVCKHCSKSFKYRTNLSLHMKTHNEVLPYYCHICGQGFVEGCRLKYHMMVHTKPEDKPFKCTVCDKRFGSTSHLSRHLQVHTGVKSHICDICGSSFTRLENLRSHINGVHKKVRRFTCGECNAQFVTNYQLKCHSMQHSGERPYACTVCKANFIQRKDLRKHMKSVHKLSLEGHAIDNDKRPSI